MLNVGEVIAFSLITGQYRSFSSFEPKYPFITLVWPQLPLSGQVAVVPQLIRKLSPPTKGPSTPRVMSLIKLGCISEKDVICSRKARDQEYGIGAK